MKNHYTKVEAIVDGVEVQMEKKEVDEPKSKGDTNYSQREMVEKGDMQHAHNSIRILIDSII